jgi:hypothetical protein
MVELKFSFGKKFVIAFRSAQIAEISPFFSERISLLFSSAILMLFSSVMEFIEVKKIAVKINPQTLFIFSPLF